MTPAETFVSKLDGVQGRGPRWRAICPAHESKHRTRSLAVAEADDGRVLVKCFAGCSIDQIVGAVGMSIEDLFPPRDVGEKKRERRPFSPREIALALERELTVAWVLLGDIGAGKVIGKSDRERAKVCAERCAAMLLELTA